MEMTVKGVETAVKTVVARVMVEANGGSGEGGGSRHAIEWRE